MLAVVMRAPILLCLAPLGCAWPAAAADAPHLRPHLLAARRRVVAPETGAGQRRGAFSGKFYTATTVFAFRSEGNDICKQSLARRRDELHCSCAQLRAPLEPARAKWL